MHLILTGATGLVGSGVLSYILSLPATSTPLTRLTILSRRPIPMLSNHSPLSPHIKIETIIHNDFSVYPDSLLEKLRGAKGVIWALGIGSLEVPKDEYVRITKEYPLAAARAFAELGGEVEDGTAAPAVSTSTTNANATQAATQGAPTIETTAGSASSKFNFIYVSGEGASHTPSRFFTPLFGTVKGETEIALAKLAHSLSSQNPSNTQLNTISVRAGAVDPRHDDPRVGEAVADKKSGKRAKGVLGHTVFPAMTALMPGMMTPTDRLGRVLVELALMEGKGGVGDDEKGKEGGNIGGVTAERLDGLTIGKEVVFVDGMGKGEGKVVTNLGIRRLSGL